MPKINKYCLVISLFFFHVLVAEARVQLDSSETKKSWFGVPVVFYAQKTNWAFGASGGYYFKTDTIRNKYSSFQIVAIHTLNNQSQISFVPKWFHPSGKVFYDGKLMYEKFPTKFFGIGSEAFDNPETYYPKQFVLSTNAQYYLTKTILLGGHLGYQYSEINRFDKGSVLEKSELYGIHGYNLLSTGLLFTIDNRENQFYPLKGSFLKLSSILYSSLRDDQLNFGIYNLDFRKYFSIKKKYVLATQINTKVSDGHIPFQLLPKIGGMDLLRGYYYGRYSDNIAIVMQAEFRFPVYKRLFGACFIGSGDVFHSFSKISFNSAKTAGGIGIRYRVNESRLQLRFDTAVNVDYEVGVYFTASEAF